ncbi:MAG: hypothetical protein ACK6DA_14960 [Candidatus Kapaibacterium sp.]
MNETQRWASPNQTINQPPAIDKASDFRVLKELEARCNRILANPGRCSDEFIRKVEDLHTALGRVRVHL